MADSFSFVAEIDKGEEWLVFVGGISGILDARAGVSKNSHEGGRTGAFPTATSSPRRNEQKSTRVMIGDLNMGHSTRRNEQKSTWDEKIGWFHTCIVHCAGMSKRSHDA